MKSPTQISMLPQVFAFACLTSIGTSKRLADATPGARSVDASPEQRESLASFASLDESTSALLDEAETSDSKPKTSSRRKSGDRESGSERSSSDRQKKKKHSKTAQETNYALVDRIKQHPRFMKGMKAVKKGRSFGKCMNWALQWEFPAIENYTRDRGTTPRACLNGLDDALAYLKVPELKANLLETLDLSIEVMSAHKRYGPYEVFDNCEGRTVKGTFTQGPRNSFKIRAVVTLFMAAAYLERDTRLHEACTSVLDRFTGDLSYSDLGSGAIMDRKGLYKTAGSGSDRATYFPLAGCDRAVLKLMAAKCQHCGDLVNDQVCLPLGP